MDIMIFIVIYVDDAQCEYKVIPVDEDMSTNDHFQEQSCEDNTIEEPSAVEDPTVFEDASEASIIATDLVNDESQQHQVKIFAQKMKL